MKRLVLGCVVAASACGFHGQTLGGGDGGPGVDDGGGSGSDGGMPDAGQPIDGSVLPPSVRVAGPIPACIPAATASGSQIA